MYTCISTSCPAVDKGCGQAVDNVDKPRENRDIPAFFPPETVDKPVDTVDEYFLWLCIVGYAAMHTISSKLETAQSLANIRFLCAAFCMHIPCIQAGNPASDGGIFGCIGCFTEVLP